MSAALAGMILRYSAEIRKKREAGDLPLRLIVKRHTCHHALVTAWRQESNTSRYLGRWSGPGVYELSGNYEDGATVTKVAELPSPTVVQGELGI